MTVGNPSTTYDHTASQGENCRGCSTFSVMLPMRVLLQKRVTPGPAEIRGKNRFSERRSIAGASGLYYAAAARGHIHP